MRGKIVIRNGQHVGQTFYVALNESKILGRDASCDIQMYDKGLSRSHSLLENKDGRYMISDLGSTNGTFVNGKMVISKALEDGDLVNVGKIEAQFFLERSENPVSSSVRIVEDGDSPLGPQTIVRRVDLDSVISPVGGPPTEPGAQAQLESYQRAFQTLYQLGAEFNAVEDLDELFGRVMDQIMSVLAAERGYLILYDTETRKFEPVIARSRQPGAVKYQVSQTVLTKVVEEDLAVLSHNAMADDRFKGGMSIILNQIKSVMCVPLKSQNEVLGAIYVDSRGTSELFQDKDLELLAIIGIQAGIAAQRIRLNQQVLEQAKLKQALEVARGIQRSFLPQGVPEAVHLDLVGWSESCDETGGDYYDFIPCSDGVIGIGVGDVSGHGVGAALLMATARAFLRALLRSQPQISTLFNELNTLLEEDLKDDQFMTFFFCLLNPNTWELTYTSAGHEPAFIYRAARNCFEELPSLGVPLGMLPGYEYEQAGPFTFMEGDILVLVTDGIIEMMNPANEEFARTRMEQVIQSSANLSANQIVRNIHEAVMTFAEGRPMRDDLTLVVVKFVAMHDVDIEATNITQGV